MILMSRSIPLNFSILEVSVYKLRKCAIALSCSFVVCFFVLFLRHDQGILGLHSFTTVSIKLDNPFYLVAWFLIFLQ